MSLIIERILASFISKKRVIGWVSAVIIAISAVAAGMSSSDFKDAVCGAPVIEQQKTPDVQNE